MNLAGAIAAFPIRALALEKELASKVSSDDLNDSCQNLIGNFETFGIAFKKSRTRLPKFSGFDDGLKLVRF